MGSLLYCIDCLLFLVIPRFPKTCSQNIATSNLFQAVPLSLSLLSPMVVILITRLAVILKFPYMCCYGVLITKQFNWQAGEAQCFDCHLYISHFFIRTLWLTYSQLSYKTRVTCCEITNWVTVNVTQDFYGILPLWAGKVTLYFKILRNLL